MTSRVTVIAGPARSGKTHALLKDYRNVLRGQRGAGATGTVPIGGTLWIGPNRRAVEQVRDALLADGLTGCFDPGIQTFDQFARRVTSHAASEVRPIDDRSKRLLLEQLLREALAAGKLKHFAAIAHTSGFLDLTARFISELKRVEIWPEQFEDACKRAADFAQRGKPAQRERELIELYKSYQDILEKHQLYDAEGLFWSARSLLHAGQRAPCDGLKLVVVDGFTDFTRTQLEILDELARRGEQLVISLTDEESNERAKTCSPNRGGRLRNCANATPGSKCADCPVDRKRNGRRSPMWSENSSRVRAVCNRRNRTSASSLSPPRVQWPKLKSLPGA